MKKIFLAVSLLALLAGCSTFKKPEPLATVDRVDLDRFMGTWYVIGSVQGLVDRNPFNSTNTYERGSRGIDITYSFNAGSYDGKLKTYKVRALVDNPGINSDWEVRYVTWPFESDYRVIYLESDYSVAVIGQPSRNYVWILSRDTSINAPLYSDIILYLQDLGYDVGNIRLVPHG
jgi:apolipoprotein D and lipocalin family protein